ncbi:hypothetical protein RB597_005629 [Gaeumannomyces tritici]
MDAEVDREASKPRYGFGRGRAALLVNAVLFFTSVFLNLWYLSRLELCQSPGRVLSAAAQTPTRSSHYPLELLAKFAPKRFEADLGSKSVYKGQPRKELDDAWDKLVDHPMILADKETLRRFDPTTKPTKGTRGHYYATVEMFHQLHCLDITRKYIWRDDYKNVDTFQNPPEIVLEHVDHCIDLLRQYIMCHEDLGLLFYTNRGRKQPEARVSTTHTCRNFSQIAEWVAEHDSELGMFVEA